MSDLLRASDLEISMRRPPHGWATEVEAEPECRDAIGGVLARHRWSGFMMDSEWREHVLPRLSPKLGREDETACHS